MRVYVVRSRYSYTFLAELTDDDINFCVFFLSFGSQRRNINYLKFKTPTPLLTTTRQKKTKETKKHPVAAALCNSTNDDVGDASDRRRCGDREEDDE